MRFLYFDYLTDSDEEVSIALDLEGGTLGGCMGC